MASKASKITQAACLNAFDYNPLVGALVWKERATTTKAVNARWAGKEAGTVMVTEDGKSYRKVCLSRTQILAHRVIWIMLNGPIPAGMEIDHVDGNGLNNALTNLRLVDHGQNMKNVRLAKNNVSGANGVRRTAAASERWQAYAVKNGRFYGLGSYASVDEAKRARQAFDASNGFHENHGEARPL